MVTATVTDQVGNPVTDGVQVEFVATGTGAESPGSGTVLTKGGVASFSFTSLVAGLSEVRASAGSLSSRASVLWMNPPPDTGPRLRLVESVPISSGDDQGSYTRFPLLSGDPYVIEVIGTYQYAAFASPRWQADAECSSGEEGTWSQDRYAALEPLGDPLDVYLAGEEVSWSPLPGTESVDDPSCSRQNAYRTSRVGSGERLNLTVHDLNYGDNSGVLTANIYAVVN